MFRNFLQTNLFLFLSFFFIFGFKLIFQWLNLNSTKWQSCRQVESSWDRKYNPQDCLDSFPIKDMWKGINPSLIPPAMDKIIGQIRGGVGGCMSLANQSKKWTTLELKSTNTIPKPGEERRQMGHDMEILFILVSYKLFRLPGGAMMSHSP